MCWFDKINSTRKGLNWEFDGFNSRLPFKTNVWLRMFLSFENSDILRRTEISAHFVVLLMSFNHSAVELYFILCRLCSVNCIFLVAIYCMWVKTLPIHHPLRQMYYMKLWHAWRHFHMRTKEPFWCLPVHRSFEDRYDTCIKFYCFVLVKKHKGVYCGGHRSMNHQVSNVRCTLVGNKMVDHSDVVGASPVGVAPTTSSFLT